MKTRRQPATKEGTKTQTAKAQTTKVQKTKVFTKTMTKIITNGGKETEKIHDNS